MSFKWKEDYSCNTLDIDTQHKKLLEIGDRIVDLAMGSQDSDYYDQIMEVLVELKDYTVYHFGFEEKLMDKYGYYKSEEHKFEHLFFIKKVEKIERKDIDGQQQEAIMALLKFVADWVTSHIMLQDKEFGAFLKTVGFN